MKKNKQHSNHDKTVEKKDAITLKKQILKERARLLAAEPQQKDLDHSKQLELLEFQIDNERYGIETQYITKVHSLRDLTPLPLVPEFIVGIINVHGQVATVIDIRRLFDLPKAILTDRSKAILIKVPESFASILADDIFGVVYVSENKVQSTISTLTGVRANYLKGVTLDQVVIIDPIKLMQDNIITVNQKT